MTILITGSSRGLGYHLGKLFEASSNTVLYHRRNQDVACDGANVITADLLNEDQINSELLRVKDNGLNVEHLICNAGKSSYLPASLSSFKNVQTALNENVVVTSNAIHGILQHHVTTLKSITLIGSICGEEYIKGAPIEYCIAKSTLQALNKSCAHHLAASGIRCNMITPGNLLFEGSVWHKKIDTDRSAVEAYLEENVPSASMGSPKHIYDAIKYVISADASFLNGANIVIDGGQTRTW